MSNNAHDLSNRLLNALDSNYNVVDMQTVNEIISVLEKFSITKELLETTRLGKHVNELRRKTTDPTLARRAKVLVKRWRDLVIPNVASPAHTGSNRSSAERQVRRLGGTPLTSPALARQVLSPAVPSPRPLSRPAWGGYESDSQDVILVDDEPDPPAPRRPPPLAAPGPSNLPSINTTPPMKRAATVDPLCDDKTARRDKKPKKRRGHSRAGSGAGAGADGWGARNGAARNGCRTHDVYAALVNRIPKAGDKKVKTTKELLEEIQSRGSKTAAPPSPDVMLVITDPEPIKVDSPLRNGDGSRPGSPPLAPSSPPAPTSPSPFPLEDPREYAECTCGEEEVETCPAAQALSRPVGPHHVLALHHALVPGVNGTRAPAVPHPFARRTAPHPDHEGLFASVVPLYNYSDYADDYCVKNLSRLPLCEHIPWTEFAPSPPPLPRPPTPPTPRPYPIDPPDEPTDAPDPDDDVKTEVKSEPNEPFEFLEALDPFEPLEQLGPIEGSERLKGPPPTGTEPGGNAEDAGCDEDAETPQQFASSPPAHRTVERTKAAAEAGGGARSLTAAMARAAAAARHSYAAADCAGEAALEPASAVSAALRAAAADDTRDALGRPPRPQRFAEWHEPARLGSLLALPYVVID